ncbi:FmdE family protein [Acetivibrio sp. MSJd-27]|jgi:fwdE family protein|uniref:FmdE family protein n=1 Tax=Acetivibrio sp. MSJd-27 TaxID=2841523 RepID=UPI0015AAB06F|nr:FmdE family protein [Acetivibrio sp. MSJd-27]MBU5450596.1 TraR/DksA C4-type zinc finger protein [Acetivibrio sp. MSJd-27]
MNQMFWDTARKFHGHECPGLAIGVKACEAAVEKMGVMSSEDEELVCVTENDACGVDAVQAILGCSLGKGNLLYHSTGKMAFNFFDRRSGKKLRICLKARNSGMERKAYMNYLLQAPVDEIFSFGDPKMELPPKAGRFPSIPCEICGEAAPEHKMRLQDGKKVCLDCFHDYSRGWK